jgi:hypothetical protein
MAFHLDVLKGLPLLLVALLEVSSVNNRITRPKRPTQPADRLQGQLERIVRRIPQQPQA